MMRWSSIVAIRRMRRADVVLLERLSNDRRPRGCGCHVLLPGWHAEELGASHLAALVRELRLEGWQVGRGLEPERVANCVALEMVEQRLHGRWPGPTAR